MMRLITPTLLEKSSKQLSKETDWDLLEQMDEEDEGQVRPLMDPTGNPLASTKNLAQEASLDPHRQLDDRVMQEIFRRQAKAKGATHSKASEFQIPMGSPNTLFKKQT